MVFPKIVSGLLVASVYLASCQAQYASDYDGSYDTNYREVEPAYDDARSSFRGDDVPAASVERASPAVPPHGVGYSAGPVYSPGPHAAAPAYSQTYPSSDSNSYHLYHRDQPLAHAEMHHEEAPQHDHKHHHNSHDHGTSSMSFYQKVKHHEHKFKLEQKHGKKHGSFHGLAHPYAYGGLKVHDF